MGIQDKVARTSLNWQRKLRDYKIFLNGFNGKVIRIKASENRYGDETIEVISHEIINVYLDIPGEVPLTRLRKDVVTPTQIQTDNTFLFDILPIRGYARFQDNVEKGDFLIHKIYDEMDDRENPFMWILRVSEIFGTINIRQLTHRQFDCAVYNGILTTEVQQIVNDYDDDQENL